MPVTVVKAENVTVVYRSKPPLPFAKPREVVAVENVSLEIREGEILCVVGESGCGKTSLGLALAGLLPPESVSGKVLFRPSETVLEAARTYAGSAVDESGMLSLYEALSDPGLRKAIRREIQVVFQDPYGSANPFMPAIRIVMEPLLAAGMEASEARRRARQLLEEVGLDPGVVEDKKPSQLSGGELQRVMIARALAPSPRFLVEDEPVTMLDVSVKAEVLEVLLRLKKERGIAQLFITHDLGVARYVCDRIAVMYLGVVVEEAETEELIRKPLHPYTRALLSAVMEPDPRRRLINRPLPIKTWHAAERPPKGCLFRPRCVAYDQRPEIQELCDNEQPPLVEHRPGHTVRCWIYAQR